LTRKAAGDCSEEKRGDGVAADPVTEKPGEYLPESVLFESPVFVRRLIRLSENVQILCDALPEDGVEIQFGRWTADSSSDPASFAFSGESTGLRSDARMGTFFLRGADGDTPALWSPRGLVVGSLDQNGRFSAVDDSQVESWWELSGSPVFHLSAQEPGDFSVFWPMVVFAEDSNARVSDLVDLQHSEFQEVVKSDRFRASSAADIWKYLIDGAIFGPRDDGRRRSRCQQCAFAWWSYLMALHLETSKNHYRSFARWIAWSVCADLDKNESWHYGLSTTKPEIRARCLWDGVRLLLAENSVAPDDILLSAARRAGTLAVDNLSEELDGDRLWFLEGSVEGATRLRIPSQVLGRSRDNSLCLNTHLQALCVLHQLVVEGPGDDRFSRDYRRGMEGLEAVLALRGGNWATAALDRMLPAAFTWKSPRGARERVLRLLFYRVAGGLYWRVRKRVPGLVFGSGYLDRDVGVTMLADEYHVVNLKAMLELYRLDQKPWLTKVIEDAAAFVAKLDFRRCLERDPLWCEWLDVLEMWAPDLVDIEVEFAEVEAAVLEQLGALSVDTFCHRAGLRPVVGGAGSRVGDR
jgi:hypothetical protein